MLMVLFSLRHSVAHEREPRSSSTVLLWKSRGEVLLPCLLNRCVSSSLSSPPLDHLFVRRVNVRCRLRCLRGAGQDSRHAFRDALCHSDRSPPVCAVHPVKPVRSRVVWQVCVTIFRRCLHSHQPGCASGTPTVRPPTDAWAVVE